MKNMLKAPFTILISIAFILVFITAAFSDTVSQRDLTVNAQASQGGSPSKGKGQTPNTEAGNKMKAAIEKYKSDPLFQQLMQEDKKNRDEVNASRKKSMDEQNAKITKITAEYQPKIDSAKTEEEKKALRQEMQGKTNIVMQTYKKEADLSRRESQEKNKYLEKKYGAKFPDYFTAKNEMIMEMQKGMNKSGKSGQQGGFGQGQGSNDPSRQKMMSINQKYKNDPDFKKMTDEMTKARDEMRLQMQNAGQNPSERRRIMQNFQAKMQEMEKKYGSKFPDYFKALEEMRKNRQSGSGI